MNKQPLQGSVSRPQPISAGGDASSLSARLLLLLLAFTPLLFAIASWDTGSGAILGGGYRAFSVPVLAVELTVIVYALRSGFGIGNSLRASPLWAQVAVGLLLCIGYGTALFVAEDRSSALLRTVSSTIHLLFGLAAAHLILGPWHALRSQIWPLVVAGSAAYLLVLVLFVIAIPDPARFDWSYFGLGVINVRQLGFYSVVGACGALGLAGVEPSRRRYMLLLVAASLLLGLSYWSGTRGSLFATFVAFAAAWLVLPYFRSPRSAIALLAANAVGAALSVLHAPSDDRLYGIFRMAESVSTTSADEMGSGRLEFWAGTLRVALQRPVFGFGESQFRIVVPEAVGTYNHPHNVFLQIMLQWGGVGALCFFALGSWLLWRSWGKLRGAGPDIAPAVLVLAGLLTMSLYEGSLYHPYPISLVALSLVYILTAKAQAPAKA